MSLDGWLTSPLKLMWGETGHQFVFEKVEMDRGKTFGEDVCHLIDNRDKFQINIFVGHPFTNEVHINLNMFGTGVEDRIESQGDCPNVITPDNGRR